MKLLSTLGPFGSCGVDGSCDSLCSPKRQGTLAKIEEQKKGEPCSKVSTCCNANCICYCSVDRNSSLISSICFILSSLSLSLAETSFASFSFNSSTSCWCCILSCRAKTSLRLHLLLCVLVERFVLDISQCIYVHGICTILFQEF